MVRGNFCGGCASTYVSQTCRHVTMCITEQTKLSIMVEKEATSNTEEKNHWRKNCREKIFTARKMKTCLTLFKSCL